MNYQVTKEVLEEAIKAKINRVEGNCALIIPADVSQEDFEKAVLNLIARGKRNFSQALDSHAEFTFANLISTKTREGGGGKVKLPEKVKDAIADAKNVYFMNLTSGAHAKLYKAKANGRNEVTFATDMLVYMVNKKLGDAKSKKGIFKDEYAEQIKAQCAEIAGQKPESSDIMEADF